MSKIINIKNESLTGYYLEENFVKDLTDNHIVKGCKESGLIFINDPQGKDAGTIELHYNDEKDLENKISYILMILTDK